MPLSHLHGVQVPKELLNREDLVAVVIGEDALSAVTNSPTTVISPTTHLLVLAAFQETAHPAAAPPPPPLLILLALLLLLRQGRGSAACSVWGPLALTADAGWFVRRRDPRDLAAGLWVSLIRFVSFPVGGLPSSPSGGLWFEDKVLEG